MLKKIWNNDAKRHLAQVDIASADIEKQQGVSFNGRAAYTTIRKKLIRADGTTGSDVISSFGHRNPVLHFIGAPLAYFNGWLWNRFDTFIHNRRST